MFAHIKTNGATDIVIHVPHEGAHESLPALAAMLEQNAVFLQLGYSEHKVVKPEMGITLGESLPIEARDEQILIRAENSDAILDSSFVIATPEVFASHAAALSTKNTELMRSYTEAAHLRDEVARLKEEVSRLQDLAPQPSATGNDAEAAE